MKKNIIIIIFLMIIMGLCFIADYYKKESNEESVKGSYGKNILMGGKASERIIDSNQLSKTQEVDTSKDDYDLKNEDFINEISNMIKNGKILNDKCTEYYIYDNPIYEIFYVFPSIYQDEDDTECKALQGVRYIISTKKDFSDAEAIVYIKDNFEVRKDYMLSEDLLKNIINTQKEYGVIVSENRAILIDAENNVKEQHVNDNIYFSTSGDCFEKLKEKGFVFDASGIYKNENIIKINIE